MARIRHLNERANPLLSASYVAYAGETGQRTIKPNGDARPGVFEWIHDSNNGGYIFHLMTGVNTTGSANNPALIGLGIDNGGTGVFVNNKKTGVGVKIVQNDTITSATAFGLEVVQNSAVAPAARVTQADGAVEAWQFFAPTVASATQTFIKVITPAGTVGEILSQSGNIHWKADVVTHDGGIVRARALGASTDNDQTKVKPAEVQFTSYTGSPGLFWHKRITHGGQSLKVDLADTLGGGPDAAPTYITAVEFKNESGVNKIGFFGATPAAKPSGVAVNAAGIHAALVTLGLIAA